MRPWVQPVGFACLIFALDRVSKYVFMNAPDIGPHVFSTLVTITRHWNHGLIANLPVPKPLIITLSCLAILGLSWLWQRETHRQQFSALFPLACVLAGAVGNLYDRFAWGAVFDWILVGGRSIINLADAAIFIGMAWYVMQEHRRRRHNNGQAPLDERVKNA